MTDNVTLGVFLLYIRAIWNPQPWIYGSNRVILCFFQDLFSFLGCLWLHISSTAAVMSAVVSQ